MFSQHFLLILVLASQAVVRSEFTDKYCWPDNKIPYNISQGFDAFQLRQIERQMEMFHSKTCLRWVVIEGEFTRVSHFVQFIKDFSEGDCKYGAVEDADHDTVAVTLSLADVCFEQRLLLQNMMQALGFSYEHQRPDRFCYVEMEDEADVVPDYQVKPIENWLEQFPYDTSSVMHSKNTMFLKPKKLPFEEIPRPFANPGDKLSFLDLFKLQYKYCGKPHFCRIHKRACAFSKERAKGNCSAY